MRTPRAAKALGVFILKDGQIDIVVIGWYHKYSLDKTVLGDGAISNQTKESRKRKQSTIVKTTYIRYIKGSDFI